MAKVASSTTLLSVPAWLATEADPMLPFLGLVFVCLGAVPPLQIHRPEVHEERFALFRLPVLAAAVAGDSADLTLYSDGAGDDDVATAGTVLTDPAGDLPRRMEGPGDEDRMDGVAGTT